MRLTCAVAGSAGLRIGVGPPIDEPRVVLLNDGSTSRPGRPRRRMHPCSFRCCPGVADEGEGEGRGRMSGVNVPQSAWSPDDPFAGHPDPVWAMAVTPDGRQIITGGDDGTARLWDRASGRLQTTLTAHTGPVWAVAVTPDGRQIVTGGGDGTARLWDRASGRLQTTLTGHTGPVWAVAGTPDGRQIITGGDDTARLWDRTSGQLQTTLT